MRAWDSRPGVYEAVPLVRDTDSLQAMDSAARTTRGASVTLGPVLPCQRGKTWLELTVLDSRGQPVAQADCTLKISEGNGMTQKTDDKGYVKFEGISADPQRFTVQLETASDDSQGSGYVISVVPKKHDTAPSAEADGSNQGARYVELPWERDSLIWSE